VVDVTSGERPPLSVVIASRNRARQLNECLTRLQGVVGPADEIVVVDSCSSDDETRRMAVTHGTTLVTMAAPGASAARNAGWRAARHGLIAFLDDDVMVQPGWADAMVRALTRSDAAFVTGWIGVPPGQEEVPGPLPLMIAPEPRPLTVWTEGAFGAGANWGARKSALEAVGGFDERLGPGRWWAAAEDVDLFDRLVIAGRSGWYDPKVRIDHDMWRGRRERLTLHWRYGKGMGARLAKLAALDHGRFRRECRDALWTYGTRSLLREIADRWWGGALCTVLRLTSTTMGLALGWVTLRRTASVRTTTL
jgi:GT2 family glycosyltransferase